MKGKLLIILSGVALLHLFLLGGIALTGGCSSSDDESPVNSQNYVPAPSSETAQPAAPATTTDITPATPVTTPAFVAPSPTSTAGNEFRQPAAKADLVKYTIQPGDSLWKISRKYGVSVDELASYNQITSNKGLKVGQTITIPPGGKLYNGAEKAAAGKKVVPVKKTVGTAAPKVGSKAPSAKTEKAEGHAVAGAGETYAVQKGDTLDKIAKKFHVKAADIATASNISVDKMLQVGQKLTIPKSGAKGEKASKAEGNVKDAAKKGHAAESKEAKVEGNGKAADKAVEAKPAEKPAKTGDPLLDDIPSPDEGGVSTPTTGDSSVKPLASSAAVNSAASVAGEKPVASSGYTAEVDQDTTIEKLATQYGCKAEDIKKLNPELPADGKIKAPTVVKIP